MKSADFNRNEGKIRVLQEVRPTRKRINWDRIIYLAALLAALGSILFMVVKSNLYIKGEGQVLFKKLDIQLTEDIQIVNFVYRAGDSIEIGDTLFYYYSGESVREVPPVATTEEVVISNDNLAWIVRERLTTQKRIELANIQMEDNRRMINLTEKERKRIEQEVYLDVYPASKLDQYIQRLMDLDQSTVSNLEENKFHEQYLEYLDTQERIERANLIRKRKMNQVPMYTGPVLKPYISPVRGTITQVQLIQAVLKENHSA